MKTRHFFSLLLMAIALPLVGCKGGDSNAKSDPGANAKFHYAVAMTVVV